MDVQQRQSNDITIEVQPISAGDIPVYRVSSDMDRGLELLSSALGKHTHNNQTYKKIVEDLIDANQKNQQLLESYKASEIRWNRWKWTGFAVDGVAIALTFFAELYTRAFDTNQDNKSNRAAHQAIAVCGLAGVILTSAFAFMAYWIEGAKFEQYEKQLGLQEKDNALVKKLRMILENWGALLRAQENPESEVDANSSAKKCFKQIKDLPENEHDERLPPKFRAKLASVTVQLLDEDHPAKQAVHDLLELEKNSPRSPSDEEQSSQGFQNMGQQAAQNSVPVPLHMEEHEQKIENLWKLLQANMHGLYTDEIAFDNFHVKRRDPMMRPKRELSTLEL